MHADLTEKRFYARANRHNGECYSAVLNPAPESRALAYLRVEGKRESLIYRAAPDASEQVVTEGKYVLSPVFAGDFLLWSEQCGTDWRIRAARLAGQTVGETLEPFHHAGRPFSLSSYQADGRVWLTWEERKGKSTRICLACLAEGKWTSPAAVTHGEFNAYDPVCAAAGDGALYVAYTAFLKGNYRIVLQRFGADGAPDGAPVRVSDQLGPCLYPSLCKRKEGGLWISYTHFRFHREAFLAHQGLARHYRRQAQHAFLGESRGTVHAVIFDGERFWAPLANYPGPTRLQGNIAAGIVFGSVGAGHSQIFEDIEGQARLLFRQHESAPAPIQFAQSDDPLNHSPKPAAAQRASCNHPDLCMSTLQGTRWSPPLHIIPRAHVEAPLSCALSGGEIKLAFTEDARRGSWMDGECADDVGQLGIGLATLTLHTLGPARYELHPVVISPALGPSMEEPAVERAEGQYVHAIGQTHAHSELSICNREEDRDPHCRYRFMQDCQHADFGGIADHSYNMWHTEMLLVRKLAEYYYFPGEFIAIPIYEWIGGGLPEADDLSGGQGFAPYGHVNPLWLEESGDLEIYPPTVPEGASVTRLRQAHASQKVIAPPHHVADNLHFFNWKFFDEQFMPVVELFQDFRGSGEQPWAPGVTNWLHLEEGHWALDALKAGRRFGFIGGADHCGVALAGVLTRELTRSGLYEAFMARRCFATTGAAFHVEFTCNGHMMGKAVACEAAKFALFVRAPEPIAEIQIVLNGHTVEQVSVHNEQCKREWQAARTASGEFWYCRVILENGEMAWTSPIWLV